VPETPTDLVKSLCRRWDGEFAKRPDSAQPVLLIIGSPMGASGFGALAERFADRTVVTCDPRGAERSKRTDGAVETTVDEHADDLHRLICALDAGPADIFASSGGAVSALAMVAEHAEQVRTLVAHEPPAVQALPDRERALAANVDIHETYQRSGFGPAMAKFLTLVSLEGPIQLKLPQRQRAQLMHHRPLATTGHPAAPDPLAAAR
jgi:pimeloyl-ACP methyl ester carboxylesterase